MWAHLPFLTPHLRNGAFLRENSDPIEELDIDP